MRDLTFSRRPWFLSAALASLAFLAYANSFPGAFILDDLHIAKHNPLFEQFDLITLLRADYWYGIENSGLYRPLTVLTLYLNRLLLGPGPAGFHLVNVALHVAVTVLLWRLLRAWEMPTGGAVVAALLFAVHPLHAAVVNVVVGRSELLVALFLLLGLLAAHRDGPRAMALTALCFLMALLSKEHAIVLVGLLPLRDAFHAGTLRVWGRRWPLYAVLLGIAVGWLVWREVGLVNPLPPSRVTAAANPLIALEPLARILTALQLQGLYLWKMLSGVDLQESYAAADLPATVDSFLSLRGLLVATTAGLVLALCAWGWCRRNLLAFFAILYLVSFAPTANVVLPIGVHFAERLAYLPSVWYCAAVGAGCALLIEPSRWRRGMMAIAVCYALWLGGMLLLRNREYADEVTLWGAEVQNNPRDYLGWQNLAESYANARRPAEADAAYLRMLSLAPDYPGGLRSRTFFLLRAGRYGEALQAASHAYAIAQRSNDPADLAIDALDMAEAHLALGNHATALAFLDGILLPQMRGHARYLELRGKALANLGRDAEAVEEFSRVTIDLVGSDLRYYHGQSLFRLGRVTEARQQLEIAVKAKSDGATWNLLGVVCAQLRDLPAAVAAFDMAVELEPANGYYRENLERALREAGLFRDQ
ncbi:MAG: tetratricopeptide repeat protein [Deltaproteobacteria bacterium]|nr:MAG: tetratricopeptide repeat protein [Deltaproteobacteria bacterium]